MKIALNSYSGYGAHFALRLMSEGHDVDYMLSESKYKDILSGLVPSKVINMDHRRVYDNIGYPDYTKHDLSIFDLTGRKRQAEHSLRTTPTIGDGEFHCELEDNRLAGIELMEHAGIAVPTYEPFDDINKARAFVKKTGRRYVFKPDGGQDQDAATTYVSRSSEDLLEYFDKLQTLSKGVKFILQEFTPGFECSVEGWFNGSEFYCFNATIETKKFMNEDIGPNTGCSGNLVFTLNSQCRLVQEGLAKAREVLADVGYRGMIDLNTIITDTHCYGLEWTPRFGYDASTTFMCMYAGGFGNLLSRVAKGEVPEESWKAEFGVSARISVPPYPTEMRMPKMAGTPIGGIDPYDEDQMLKTYLYDVKMEKDKLVTAGINGLIASPVEIGSDITEAFDKLDSTLKKIRIPDMQYRTDIRKNVMKRYHEIDTMGWFK